MAFHLVSWQRMVSTVEKLRTNLDTIFPCQNPRHFVNGKPCPGYIVAFSKSQNTAPTQIPCACQTGPSYLQPLFNQKLWQLLPKEALAYKPQKSFIPSLSWWDVSVKKDPHGIFDYLATLAALQRPQPPHPLRQFWTWYLTSQQESLVVLEDLIAYQELFISPSRIYLPWSEVYETFASFHSDDKHWNNITQKSFVTLDFSHAAPLKPPGLGRTSSIQQQALERFIDLLAYKSCALVVIAKQPLLQLVHTTSPSPTLEAKQILKTVTDYRKGKKLKFATTKLELNRIRSIQELLSASSFDKLLELLTRGQGILDQLAQRYQKLFPL